MSLKEETSPPPFPFPSLEGLSLFFNLSCSQPPGRELQVRRFKLTWRPLQAAGIYTAYTTHHEHWWRRAQPARREPAAAAA